MEKINDLKISIKAGIDASEKLRYGMILGNWSNIIGKFSQDVQPTSLKDKTLSLVTNSSVMLQHFNMKKIELINKINEFLDGDIVEDIKISFNSSFEVFKFDNKIIQPEEKKQPNISEKKDTTLPPKNFNEFILNRFAEIQKLSEQRDKYLLENGHKKCKTCGMIFNGNGDNCIVCIEQKKVKKQSNISQELEYEYDEIYEVDIDGKSR